MTDGPDVPGVPRGWPVDPVLSPRDTWFERVVASRLRRRVTVIPTTGRTVPFVTQPVDDETGTGSRFTAPETGCYQVERQLTETPASPTSYADLLAQFEGLMADVPPLPREIAVSDQVTLDALLAGMPSAEPAAPWANPLGGLLSIPIRLDDTLPPGRVEIRDHDGNPTKTLLLLAGHWFDEDELRAAERARPVSLTAYYQSGPLPGVAAGPLFDSRLRPPGV